MEEKIWDILSDIEPEILEYQGDNMIVEGIIDSFMVIEIVNSIEDQLDIDIDASFVVAKNFRNKYTILQLVEKIVAGKTEDIPR